MCFLVKYVDYISTGQSLHQLITLHQLLMIYRFILNDLQVCKTVKKILTRSTCKVANLPFFTMMISSLQVGIMSQKNYLRGSELFSLLNICHIKKKTCDSVLPIHMRKTGCDDRAKTHRQWANAVP